MPDPITVTIRIQGGKIEDPGPIECDPHDRVEWKGEAVGRWIVGFTETSPFAGDKRFFTGVGGQTDVANAKNAPGDHKYWIFCRPAEGEDHEAFYLDPILTVRVSSLSLTPAELRELAQDMTALTEELSTAVTNVDAVQAELTQLARRMEESGGTSG